MAELHLTGDGALGKLVTELEEVFPPQVIDPTTSHELVLYRAGQSSVVEWIKNKLSNED